MAERLAGKVALVVGAGSVGEGWGNGKATSVLFAREGAKIFAVDIDLKAAETTVALIEGEGGTAVTHAADATSLPEIEGVVEACLGAFGRIDILQNNVGGSFPGGPVEMHEDDWHAQLRFNLDAAFLACKCVLPVMEEQASGAIVNVSSVAGLRYLNRPMVAYQTAKAGLIQFTRSVAMQYAAKGIRANTVVPGLMHTPLVSQRIADQYGGGDIAATIAKRDAMCPTGKMGDAWDVAYASLFLASDESRYVTATEIVVDGGLVARC